MDQNGNNDPRHVGSYANEILASMYRRRETLLGDITAGFPGWRRFLLGGEISGRMYPAGTVFVDSNATEICVRISIPVLGITANYTGTSANELLETIENDLDTECVPWDYDYQTKKANKEEQRKAIRGS